MLRRVYLVKRLLLDLVMYHGTIIFYVLLNVKFSEFIKKAKKCPSLWPHFRQLRNKYIENLCLAEKEYYQRLEDSVNKVTQRKKSWWQTVKFFLNKNQSSDIPALYHGNMAITDNEAKAQVLNEYFLSQTVVDDSTFSLPSDSLLLHMTSSRKVE